MSYILEALKKSQQQHEQQLTSVAPVIAATPPVSRFWPSWPLVLLSLVLLLALVLLWHNYGQGPFQATESVPATMAIANDIKASNASSAAPEDKLDRSVSSETPVVVTPAVAATAVTTATLASRPVATVNIESASLESAGEKSAHEKGAEAANAIPTSTQADGETEGTGTASHQARVQTRTLPPLSSLRKVPDLIITGHIYSSIANQRQVTMNGRLWSEGDPIAEGVRLQHITRDGIELEVDGWPLTLHRNRGWQSLTD